MYQRNQYSYNQQKETRDKYDGGLYLMILLGMGLVGISSCKALKQEKSDLIQYQMQMDWERTNYHGVRK